MVYKTSVADTSVSIRICPEYMYTTTIWTYYIKKPIIESRRYKEQTLLIIWKLTCMNVITVPKNLCTQKASLLMKLSGQLVYDRVPTTLFFNAIMHEIINSEKRLPGIKWKT